MVSANPLLSFAIPTYNFGQFINETISSILNGLTALNQEDIEIVILDGGSTDNTEDVIAKLALNHPNIRYVKQPRRGGIDKDLDTVAGMTSGQYIWLFSADDILVPGWDLKIKEALSFEPQIILVPATLCTLNMVPIREHPIFKFPKDGKIIGFSIGGEALSEIDYLRRANSLEALFSFMSAIIIKSDVWKKSASRSDYFGSCWAHCARLIPVLLGKAKLKYITSTLIQKRGENDSFMENGIVHRIGIAIDGWTRLINEFFSAPESRRILHAKLRHDISLPLLLYAKLVATKGEECRRLNFLARQHFYMNSPTIGSVISYLLFKLFPRSPFIHRVTTSFMPQLVKIRHKFRELFW